MADSITYEEFLKKENKTPVKGHDERSPTDTETTLEDMQSTILEVQDNLKALTNKTTQDLMICKREHNQVKTSSIYEYQQAMNQKIQGYEARIEDLQTEVSKLQIHETEKSNSDSDSDSSVWEITSVSSDSES